ncbi:MAG: type II toxin-antitoxin system VapC family toxin [Dehalococcoidia bacterium]
MPDQYENPYLDSSLFIAWIKDEVIEGVDRGAIVRHILMLAERHVFKINTSAITLAEVHKKRRSASLGQGEDEQVLAYFEHDFINIIDVDRGIGEEANRLCRQYGLMPNDAIHLACALRAECDVLPAWDGRFTSVDHPRIRIENPQILGQLPFPESETGQQR